MHWKYKLSETWEAPQDQRPLIWVSQPLVLHSIAALSASFLPLEHAKPFPALDLCPSAWTTVFHRLSTCKALTLVQVCVDITSSERASLTIPILL